MTRYSEKVRMAVRTSANPTGEPMTMAQLAAATGYSYEHCRKVMNGEPVGSRGFSDILCEVLGLDKDEMWRLAQSDKVRRKLGSAFFVDVPSDQRLIELWGKLADDDKERMLSIMGGIVTQKEMETALSGPPSKPEGQFAKPKGEKRK